jgi:hypothetical protein
VTVIQPMNLSSTNVNLKISPISVLLKHSVLDSLYILSHNIYEFINKMYIIDNSIQVSAFGSS